MMLKLRLSLSSSLVDSPPMATSRLAKIRRLPLLLGLLVVLPALGWACAAHPQPRTVERTAYTMGTIVRIEIRAADRATATSAGERALRAIEAVERRLSTWTGASELARLNGSPPRHAVVVSAELAEDLRHAQKWCQRTNGAFDASVGTLVAAWSLRENEVADGIARRTRPDAPRVRAALAKCGPQSWRLEGLKVTRLVNGQKFEEGGFGKGRGLDAALDAALQVDGVEEVMFDLGGQLLWSTPSGCSTRCGVSNPTRRDEVLVAIDVRGRGSLATTDCSQKGNHILDPRSGMPAADFGSVTVVAPTATAADCLSTAMFVVGLRRALELASELDGVDVVVLIRRSAGRWQVLHSPGLAGRIHILKPSVVTKGTL